MKNYQDGDITPAGPFAPLARGWYYFCRSDRLRLGPVGCTLLGSKFAAFRDAAGRAHVLDGRCAHMGADLAVGTVKGSVLSCPLHGWQYRADGACVHIPAGGPIPPFACQQVYPSKEVGGHLFFHNAPTASFEMPFYPGVDEADLIAAKPFEFVVRTPWHMVAANAFDLQHFRMAHDRTLIDAPVVDTPWPYARRITATYAISGDSFRDRFTRWFSGSQVRMSVTVYAGTNILVTAQFRRTTSYGMVFVSPLPGNRTRLLTIVWARRRRGALSRALLDPLDASIRRRFIRAFMMDDAVRSRGVNYNPETLIDADRELRDYFSWLMKAPEATD